jgi:hypothetical protein
MHPAIVLMVGMSLGVDVGWQPLDDGGVEYIIQLEPQALELLGNGDELRSDIPPFLRDKLTSYRIKVGTGELPRELKPAQPGKGRPADATPADANSANSGDSTDANPAISQRPPRNEPRYSAETPLERRSMPPPGEVDPVAQQPPRIIEPDPQSTALVNHEAAFREGDAEPGAAGPSANKPAPAASTAGEATPGRWWPLTGALLMLFVSVGGNAYLGLQWWSARQRCQQLLRQLRGLHQPDKPALSSSTGDDAGDDEDQDVRIVGDRGRR